MHFVKLPFLPFFSYWFRQVTYKEDQVLWFQVTSAVTSKSPSLWEPILESGTQERTQGEPLWKPAAFSGL